MAVTKTRVDKSEPLVVGVGHATSPHMLDRLGLRVSLPETAETKEAMRASLAEFSRASMPRRQSLSRAREHAPVQIVCAQEQWAAFRALARSSAGRIQTMAVWLQMLSDETFEHLAAHARTAAHAFVEFAMLLEELDKEGLEESDA